MNKVDMREAPPVGCHMVDLIDAPLMVSQDVGRRYGGI